MKHFRLQAGFSHMAVALALVAVLGIGFTSYRFVAGRQTAGQAAQPASQPTASVPAAIRTTADVSRAAAALDATSVDGGLNTDALNGDLNALL